MSVELETKNELRKYLLGKSNTEEEKTVIEERLMTSDEYFQEFLIEEEELIQDYVDGNLTVSEHENFERNYLITPEQQEKVKFAQTLRQLITEKEEAKKTNTETLKKNDIGSFWQRLLASPFQTVAAGLVIAGLLSLGLWGLYLRSGSNNEIITSLNKAYSKERPLESRITSFEYAPTNKTRGSEKAKTENVQRDLVKSIALKNVSESPTAENLHSLGQVYLAEKEFDKSIEQLEKAESLAPENTQILSDLGVALLEKSKALPEKDGGKSMELSARAVEKIEKALTIKPDLLEARFNKAICLQQENMPRQAIEAWREYLKFDSSSKWAEEARRNLELLEELKKSQSKKAEEVLQEFLSAYRNPDENNIWKIVSRNREMISGKLIPQQLATLILESNNNSKDEYLSALKYIGELEKKMSGDPFFFELANFYSSLSEEKRELLAEAQKSVRNGYALDLKSDYGGALNEFVNAREKFSRTGNIWEEKIAEYWIAYNEYQLDKVTDSTKNLQKLADFCEERKYHWLNSLAYSRLSLNVSAKNDLSQGVRYDQKALALAEKTSDLYQQQRSFIQLTENYKYLKQYDEALKNIDKSFQLLSVPEISLRQKHRTYLYSAQTFYEKEFYAMASLVTKESIVINDEELNDATYLFADYVQLAEIYNARKESDKAIEAAQKSLSGVERLTDESTHKKSKSRTMLRLGDAYRLKGECKEALKYYDESIGITEKIEFATYHYEAKRNRLLCFLQQEDEQAVEKELDNVLQLFETNRAKILEEQNRNSFFDDDQNIYDLAVGYEFSKGNYEAAFKYSENSRSRSLLDIQKSGAKISLENNQPQIIMDEKLTADPLELSAIKSQMPAEVQLVEYAVLADKVVIWLITKEKFETFSFNISNNELQEKVVNFLDAVEERKNESAEALSRELYQILLSPVEKSLDNNKVVFIIPNKILFYLPFNALISPQTNNYLVENYKISLAPSANVFLNCTENAKERNQSSDEKLLSVGNPVFDRQEFPNLSESLSTEKEAQGISGLYPNHNLFLGREATKDSLKKNISEAEVFHFAGHYVINVESPLLSSFLVTGEGENGKLTNYELFQQSLKKSKLIVLSACETSIERYYKSEGMIGAGRTFLASGVPLVVASSWKVDFDATTELMLKFHLYRKKDGLDTVSALQKAQIEMLKNNKEEFRQMFYWAGFSTVGGYAEF